MNVHLIIIINLSLSGCNNVKTSLEANTVGLREIVRVVCLIQGYKVKIRNHAIS